jgi:hypothetical protein
MFDPFLIALAMAPSRGSEPLSVSGAELGVQQPDRVRSLLMQPHPIQSASSTAEAIAGSAPASANVAAAAAELAAVSAATPDVDAPSARPHPLESVSGAILNSNLEAAAEALLQVGAQLHRQQTDRSISLSAGLSATPGELVDDALTALAADAAAAAAAAPPAGMQDAAGSGGGEAQYASFPVVREVKEAGRCGGQLQALGGDAATGSSSR